MPLDPQAQRYLQRAAAAPAREPTVDERRANARAQRMVRVEDRELPGPAGGIPVRIYAPPGPRPLPALVYFHGGGWVTGDLETTDATCRILAEWAGCLVMSVNYRHAPEHPFPAAVDDAYAATAWLAKSSAALEVDATRIAVGGASAGGNLAAAVPLKARAEGGPAIAHQCLIYPITDCSFETPSMLENAEGYGLSRATMVWFWDQYVPDQSSRGDPLCSPLQEPDLKGLPPAFVLTAQYDPLRDEGEAYAAKLQAAGVPVRLKRYDGMIHGFVSNAGELDQGKVALMDCAAELRKAFAREA